MDSSAGIAFLDFTDKNKQRLLEAYIYLRPRIPAVIDEFYRAIDQINLYFEENALDVELLKTSRLNHWQHLFKGDFDEEYENTARWIAIKHFETGLSHDVYVLCYMKALILINEIIFTAPGIETTIAREMSESVTKAIAIDMIHAVSPYTGDLV